MVSSYLDEYYPDATEGMYTRDAEQLAEDVAEELGVDEATVAPVVADMIEQGDIVEDTLEWVNPENGQHTVRVNVITTRDYEDVESQYISLRPRGGRYPARFKSYERDDFEGFKQDALASCSDEQERAEVESWTSWDDVRGYGIVW